jgi:hypothetical protein
MNSPDSVKRCPWRANSEQYTHSDSYRFFSRVPAMKYAEERLAKPELP